MSNTTNTSFAENEGNLFWVRIALDLPLFVEYDYSSHKELAIGTRVIVSLRNRKLVGMVVKKLEKPSIDPKKIKSIELALDDLPPMSEHWMRFANFAAKYYQRPIGEVVLPTLPLNLKKVAAYLGKRAAGGPIAKIDAKKTKVSSKKIVTIEQPDLNQEQKNAIEQITASNDYSVRVLHGITGSGKTEVYIQAVLNTLEQGKQVLFLVPEINLTPQLEKYLRGRLAVSAPQALITVIHSGLSDNKRLRSWLLASRGQASVLLGTRLAIFAEMPSLGLIIVDEEHDASYKQQDGLRYSARDLAVWRAKDLDIPVVLGSATPSLETWNHAQNRHYHLHQLKNRATKSILPTIQLVDTRRLEMDNGFSPQLLDSISERLALGQQCLIFINRRGYAPVLNCISCAWVSQCNRCTAYAVLHSGKNGRNFLQCHHCGMRKPVPRNCPDCGDPDLKPLGRGTQRVEEFLEEHFPDKNIARIDADSTRLKGSMERLLEQVHSGEVDIMIGTQMLSKGHDFVNLGLVGVINADAALYAHDFRAAEKLFSQLMQVAGRAGRHVQDSLVIIQTEYPDNEVYQALKNNDYEGFAHYTLEERKAIGLPPYAWQALLVAEGKTLEQALSFLQNAAQLSNNAPELYKTANAVTIFDPVPLKVVRVANIERAQLLVESDNRVALHNFLTQWARDLVPLAQKCRVRHVLEVDPVNI